MNEKERNDLINERKKRKEKEKLLFLQRETKCGRRHYKQHSCMRAIFAAVAAVAVVVVACQRRN